MRSYRLESDVIRDIRTYLRPLPHTYICKLNLNYVVGFPDLVIGLRGRALFLEVKRWTGRFAPIQIATLKKMRYAGLHAYGLKAKNPLTAQLIDFSSGSCREDSLLRILYQFWNQ